MNALDALYIRFNEIVIKEGRPCCFLDFISFEVNGKSYSLKHGTIRNYFSFLCKNGKIKRGTYSGVRFYTLPGYESKGKMTGPRVGDLFGNSPVAQTPIYKWLKNRPATQQAVHNIRILFEREGIWNIFSRAYPNQINPDNCEIRMPTITYFSRTDVTVVIYRTDSVVMEIGCSSRPLIFNVKDLMLFFDTLARCELYIASVIHKYSDTDVNCLENQEHKCIPPYNTWMAVSWHFGIDLHDEYSKEEFHVPLQDAIPDLYRIYTKRLFDGSKVIRIERQERPNQEVADALVRELFPDGHLKGYDHR